MHVLAILAISKANQFIYIQFFLHIMFSVPLMYIPVFFFQIEQLNCFKLDN